MSPSKIHAGLRHALGVAVLYLGLAETSRAGELWRLYQQSQVDSQAAKIAEYGEKAAAENVSGERRLYFPRVVMDASEGWLDQNVHTTAGTVFRNGHDGFERNNVLVQLDQPLLDATVSPRVAAARARLRQTLSTNQLAAGTKTRDFVLGFVLAAKFHEMAAAADAAVGRLESELTKVSRSYDAKVASLADVQTLRVALAGLQRERSNLNQRWRVELARQGVDASALDGGWVTLDASADSAALLAAGGGEAVADLEAEKLKAKAEELRQRALAEQRKSVPVLSFYGVFEHDKADSSIFGGPRRFENAEAGLMVRWNLFDRGINYAAAREYSWQQRAKEAELADRQTELQRQQRVEQEVLKDAENNLRELADLRDQRQKLSDAMWRAFEGGTDTYLNAISTYLLFQASDREWLAARYDQLTEVIGVAANQRGWSDDLVRSVDALFHAAQK